MTNIDPKVRSAGIAGLVAAVIVTFVIGKVPALDGLSNTLQDLITGGVTILSGTIAGYLREAQTWAEKYVEDHKSSQLSDLP